MVLFKDENILVISPGSKTTLVNAGLNESLTPAKIEVPTRVYHHPDHRNENYFAPKGEKQDVIYPIQQGKIVNLPAFLYFIRIIHNHALKLMGGSAQQNAVVLLGSMQWSRLQTETLTQYAFEKLRAPAFAILPLALGAAFAHNVSDALIIDVGLDKTEITPINEYQVVETARRVIPYGGSELNKSLSKSLPDLTEKQVEDLKRSDIYEVLNESDTKNSWFALNDSGDVDENKGNEEGMVDIAAIVSSGRTREILDEREKEKESGEKKKSETANMDREFNTFIDNENKTIQVGKERFHGTESLIKQITHAVGEVMQKVEPVGRRQDCWDRVVVIGRGSTVKGFKEALIASLHERYLILRSTTYSEVPSTFNTGQNTPNGSSTPMYGGMNGLVDHNMGHGQVPTTIKLARMAEYFPEWKGHGWEDAAFLGGQIGAKSIFSGQVESAFVSRNGYNEDGPSAIWEI